jgi:hypothetical protein
LYITQKLRRKPSQSHEALQRVQALRFRRDRTADRGNEKMSAQPNMYPQDDGQNFTRRYPHIVSAFVAVLMSVLTFFILRAFNESDKQRSATEDFRVQIATLNVQLTSLNKNVETLSTQMQGLGALAGEVKVLQERISAMKTSVDQNKPPMSPASGRK